jgi:DNA polymerase-3 subunit alpha
MPPFEPPAGETDNSYLQKIAEKGLKDKGLQGNKKAVERLEYELKVISQSNFSSYFLVMCDLVNFAKENKIKGITRGSAAGSLVAYVLDIAKINPLTYGLLFERFLNPERISFPDIDMDFSDTRRDELFEYLKKKYGENKVAQIVTFGKMAARAAVRDAGRAMQLPYNFCDQVAKLIPFNYTLESALQFVPELSKMYSTDEDAQKLLNVAKKLEGTIRHASVHACGVVVTPTDLTDYVPIQFAPQDNNKVITQYDMYAIEELGLLKIDLLGIRTLSEIETAENLILTRYNQSVKLQENDKKTFEILSRGETVGVFQLEGKGMRDWLVRLKPSRIEDIIAMVALYRPGPMELIPRYIKRKQGLEKAEYLHPQLEPILKNTYGICIYQEQLLQIAHQLAGFTLGEADILRKAVGKKIKTLLEDQKQKMISGMLKNKIDNRTAEKIWNWYEPFARYGFNRSHAACYAFIAYQTAFLKAHYPIEFLTAVFIHEGQDVERAKELIEEARRVGFRVLPPDINESNVNFSITDNKTIRFGLGAIKNVGAKLVGSIVEEREKGGKFLGIGNLLKRIHHKDLNKKSIESLAKAGAFDALIQRDVILGNLDELLEFQQKQKKSVFHSQRLFGASEEIVLRQTKIISIEEKLRWEKELLGIYISGHPFEKVYQKLNSKIKKIEEIKRFKELNKTCIGGVISAIKKIMTKRNEPMAALELEDLSDSIKVVFFPRIYQKTGAFLEEGKTVIITGNYDPLRGELIAEKVAEVR